MTSRRKTRNQSRRVTSDKAIARITSAEDWEPELPPEEMIKGRNRERTTAFWISPSKKPIAVAVNISPTKRITSQPARWRTSCINGVSSNGSSGTSAPPSKAMSRAASSVAVSSTSSTVTMPSTLSSALTTGMMVRA